MDLSLLELIRENITSSSPEFIQNLCDALNRDMRTFHIYGLNGTGKTYLFKWLTENLENSFYYDCKDSTLDIPELLSSIKSHKDRVIVIDHLSTEIFMEVLPSLRGNRRNLIFLLSSNGSQKLSKNILRLGFYPMSSALSAIMVEQELMLFENRHQIRLPLSIKQFIREHNFGLRGLVAALVEICDQNLGKLAEVLPQLEQLVSEFINNLSIELEIDSKDYFPIGLELKALCQIDSLWQRLKPGLDKGWMSLQEDVYVLHGGFANIRISEEERLRLFELTTDISRKFYLLDNEDEKKEFITQNPEFDQLKPYMNDLLESSFEDSLRRDDQFYQQHFLRILSLSNSKQIGPELISYLYDWQAQIFLHQGNFSAAQNYWMNAYENVSEKRKPQILLQQYLCHLASLDLLSAIDTLQELKLIDNSCIEMLLMEGIDRLLSSDFEAARKPMQELEEFEIKHSNTVASEYMIFLGYLEQKISSPWTYLRFKRNVSKSMNSALSPSIDFLFKEIDRKFCLCFNRNGELVVSHIKTLDLEYERRKTYDLFFDFHKECYFEKTAGQLKIEKSRITLLLFCLLAFFPGRRFSWSELYESIYRKKYDPELDEGTIRMAVTRMKKSLEPSSESYFGISLVNQELYLKASTKYCVIISDEEIQELHELALQLNMKPGESN